MTGTVSSDAEGQMEGVVVSAKKVGGKVTVSVVSDHEGRYVFPGNRLPAGEMRFASGPPGTTRQMPTWSPA